MAEPSSPAPESGGATRGAQTLLRGLDLLELVVRDPMSMAELAGRSGLTRATAIRLTTALIDRAFLARGKGGRLRAGPKLFRLGAIAQARHDLVAVARPHLAALSAETGLSSFLGRRDGDQSVHLYRGQGRERVMVATPVGTRRNLAETSMGKALLLDDAPVAWRALLGSADPSYRTPGFEADMEAHVARGAVIHHGPPPDSIRAVAAPVRDAAGGIVGAVSVATIAQYKNAEQLEELVPRVRDAAEAISRDLGWQGT